MNRIFLSCVIILTLMTDGSIAFCDQPDDLHGTRPNIILVMTDDQGYAQMGAHGHPWINTPNLDSLFKQSLRFNNFYVSPTCAPTRSALLTGRYPSRNGVTHTILERERMTLDATTLAQALKKNGYTSGIFGKWHLGDEEPYQPGQRGFDESFIHGAGGIGQAYDCSCADAPGNKYFDPVIRHNGNFVKTDGFCTDVFFTAAMGWIKQQKENDNPFFACITTNAPHGPFIAPDDAKLRFRNWSFAENHAGYYGMVENIDQNMGRLLTNLEKWDMEENTLLIFMSDNGTTPAGAGTGAIGKTDDGKEIQSFNAGMRGYKGSIFEGGTRVPAFWRWKGKLTPATEIHQIAAHIDVMPTLLALAGQTDLQQFDFDGISLLPLLSGQANVEPDRYLFFHQGRWEKGADPELSKFKNCAVRNQRFRFCNNQTLYDITNDPGETKNVADQHPDVVKQMRSAYEKWWNAMQPCLVNENAPNSTIRPYHVLYQKQLENGGIPVWNAPDLN
jgi:arylsulfatase A-like enzyme